MYNSLSVEDILATISEAGFKVAMQKEMQLTREMAEDFYKEHKGQEYFEELITRMTRWSLLIHHSFATIGMEMFCKIFHLMKLSFKGGTIILCNIHSEDINQLPVQQENQAMP